ncbi:MAG: superoxide dismutase [Methylacidiphilales bacterium]|nr:superoxide dismutase [Candidatus Methylacidiphilales bacterium]
MSTPPKPAGPFTVPPLPYAYEALEPSIDAETMHLHHDKHHAAYVAKLNEAVAKEPSLAAWINVEDLLKNLSMVPESVRASVRNNGGGHANHSLFWQTLSPKSTGMPTGDLMKAIDSDLGGFNKFKEDAVKAGLGLFGSGWVWLVVDSSKKLALLTTPNQDSPLSNGKYPLFGLDVWEHAYYLKYHNVRADYLKAVWSIVNWDFISKRYASSL